MKVNIIIALILLFFSGCEKPVDKVYSIRIENASSDTIYFYASYIYPDTTISSEMSRLKLAYPNTYAHWDSKEKWEEILPNDTISIFILKKDTVDTYSWTEISKEYRISKRYDLGINELKEQNWTITYQ